MDDLSDTIRKIEELTTEPGFIYTLAFILLRDLFLDPTTLQISTGRTTSTYRN